MKLPDYYMTDTRNNIDMFNTLFGLAKWLEEKKPDYIEMTQSQFWEFTHLQPLNPGVERYWTTFHGIPIRCPEMTEDQQRRLGLIYDEFPRKIINV